ncbi:rhomboid-like protein 15 [Aristolochia californica]|uniref:rhomboid-like protein 15 n=1 Tax=Aristolochia californica TaxID=171875 RepID=UPI0035E2CF67
MRSNIVSEAGLPTRISQWWGGVPFITSSVVILCGLVYLVCLLFGYDSFIEICFLPSAVISQFQVYRIYTSVIFHGSLLHVLFNMLAFVPLGSELERIMGSLRLLHLTALLATTNAIFHLLIALIVAHNPLKSYPVFINECGIGFSGIVFSMIVIETNLSGVQSRSVFGLFNVPAKWYAWILLIVFQILMTNVSLLGHLCGILSGFAYTYGLFNFLLASPSFYSSIESSSFLSACVRRPRYIMCTGGSPSGYLPTHSSTNTASSGLVSGGIWQNISSWMPQRETTDQDSQRFPGQGRTLGSGRTQAASDSDSSLQARLLDDHLADGRQSTAENVGAAVVAAVPTPIQSSGSFDEEVKKLVAIGFEKTQVEVALAAADGDPNLAVEILMSQRE